MTGIVTFLQLQRLCRPAGPLPRPSTVRRWAERQHIRYKHDTTGGIWTTLHAVNAALGLREQSDADTEKPEALI